MKDWAGSWYNLDYDTLKLRLKELDSAFHTVRVIEPRREMVVEIHRDRVEYLYPVCDAPWNRRGDCKFCAIRKAWETRERAEKFEFIDNDIYSSFNKSFGLSCPRPCYYYNRTIDSFNCFKLFFIQI